MIGNVPENVSGEFPGGKTPRRKKPVDVTAREQLDRRN